MRLNHDLGQLVIEGLSCKSKIKFNKCICLKSSLLIMFRGMLVWLLQIGEDLGRYEYTPSCNFMTSHEMECHIMINDMVEFTSMIDWFTHLIGLV